MIGGRLFRRFMLRFLLGFAITLMLVTFIVHLFHKRFVYGEWHKDLRQEAVWAARHMRPNTDGRYAKYANAWRTMHSKVRVTFFDSGGVVVADSHPERPPLDVFALRSGEQPFGYLAAAEAIQHGGSLVFSRPWVPVFPHGMHWELVLGALVVVIGVHLLLYPLVRSISHTLRDLGQLAEEVSAGHFGKTLSVRRDDELGTLVTTFNDMSCKLAEAEQLNTRLLHDVSHELRSPLGRIRVMAETCVLRPNESRACVQGITQEVELLDRLVDDLLHVARIEASEPTARAESFSLLAWARETSRRLGGRVRQNGIAWLTHLPGVDRELRGDPQRLAQALGNLVDNAMAALEGAAEPRIELRVVCEGEACRITVADNGVGIPEGDLPHVFRRFYRVGVDRARERGGVGLGLSLVRAIVEAHGGHATIESEHHGGTRVSLVLPTGATNVSQSKSPGETPATNVS